MNKLKQLIEQLNSELYNPVGLNILWPHNVAFLYVSGSSIYPFQSESLPASASFESFGLGHLIEHTDCVIHIWFLLITWFILDWRSLRLNTMSVRFLVTCYNK